LLSVTLNDWWSELSEEKYWMVAPARGVLGPALMAPRHSAADRRLEWTHEIVSLVEPGDTVFVWDRSARTPGITSWGRAIGPRSVELRPRLVRGRETPPIAQWMMPVSDTLPLAQPIDLASLRKIGSDIVALRDELAASADGPLYFPFIGGAPTLAPAPGYAMKFPRDLFALLNARYGFDFAL
jgi:hypothetical protein